MGSMVQILANVELCVCMSVLVSFTDSFHLRSSVTRIVRANQFPCQMRMFKFSCSVQYLPYDLSDIGSPKRRCYNQWNVWNCKLYVLEWNEQPYCWNRKWLGTWREGRLASRSEQKSCRRRISLILLARFTFTYLFVFDCLLFLQYLTSFYEYILFLFTGIRSIIFTLCLIIIPHSFICIVRRRINWNFPNNCSVVIASSCLVLLYLNVPYFFSQFICLPHVYISSNRFQHQIRAFIFVAKLYVVINNISFHLWSLGLLKTHIGFFR